jgi:hypothetical protein
MLVLGSKFRENFRIHNKLDCGVLASHVLILSRSRTTCTVYRMLSAENIVSVVDCMDLIVRKHLKKTINPLPVSTGNPF